MSETPLLLDQLPNNQKAKALMGTVAAYAGGLARAVTVGDFNAARLFEILGTMWLVQAYGAASRAAVIADQGALTEWLEAAGYEVSELLR